MAEDNNISIVEINGDEFEIGEPDVFHVLRVAKVLANLGLRSENLINRLVESPSDNATIMAVLASLSESDVYKVAAAAFQFDDEREGVRYFKKEGLKLTPLVQAIMLNLNKADDIATAFEVFTTALPRLMPALLSKVTGKADEEAEAEAESED